MKQQMTCLSIQPQNDTLHNYVYINTPYQSAIGDLEGEISTNW